MLSVITSKYVHNFIITSPGMFGVDCTCSILKMDDNLGHVSQINAPIKRNMASRFATTYSKHVHVNPCINKIILVHHSDKIGLFMLNIP